MKKILSAIASRFFVTGVLVGGALLFTASNAVSQTLTLADLAIPGTSITNGDKVFFNFQNISQVGDLTVPLGSIYVVPIIVGADYGIQFQSSLWSLSGTGQNYDLGFTFQVMTADGQALIDDNSLLVTGAIDFDGATHIAETITDTSFSPLASSLVYITSTGQNFVDHEVFPGGPYAVIDISKDFSMTTGADPLSQVFVSHFDQVFSQVPEPSSALFLGLGGLALVWRRRFTR
jgi:hypothetical protein